MRTVAVFAVVVGLSAVVAGCGSRDGPPGAAGAFASRFDAAKAIGNPTTRADAMYQLALDAASGGDLETTKKALDATGDPLKRDEAASKAALNLARIGKGDDANVTARTIGNPTLRDQTLARIAKGDFQDKPAN
jgi:hypothetical protein